MLSILKPLAGIAVATLMYVQPQFDQSVSNVDKIISEFTEADYSTMAIYKKAIQYSLNKINPYVQTHPELLDKFKEIEGVHVLNTQDGSKRIFSLVYFDKEKRYTWCSEEYNSLQFDNEFDDDKSVYGSFSRSCNVLQDTNGDGILDRDELVFFLNGDSPISKYVVVVDGIDIKETQHYIDVDKDGICEKKITRIPQGNNWSSLEETINKNCTF